MVPASSLCLARRGQGGAMNNSPSAIQKVGQDATPDGTPDTDTGTSKSPWEVEFSVYLGVDILCQPHSFP